MTESGQPPPLPRKQKPKGMSKKIIALLVVLAVIVCLIPVLLGIGGAFFAFTSLKERAKTEQEGLAFLRSLNAPDIVKVVVSTDSMEHLKTITNQASRKAFADAAHDVERYFPNHPSYASEFYVELYLANGQRREYEFNTMHSPDQTLYIDFVHKKGAWTSYHGNGKSTALFRWMRDEELIE